MLQPSPPEGRHPAGKSAGQNSAGQPTPARQPAGVPARAPAAKRAPAQPRQKAKGAPDASDAKGQGGARRRIVLWSTIGGVAGMIVIAGIALWLSQPQSPPPSDAATNSTGTPTSEHTTPTGGAATPAAAGNSGAIPATAPAGSAAAWRTAPVAAAKKPPKFANLSDKEYWLTHLMPTVAASGFYEKILLDKRTYTETPYPTNFQKDGLGHLNTKPVVEFECAELSGKQLNYLQAQIAILNRDPGNLEALESSLNALDCRSRSRFVPYILRFEKAGGKIVNASLYADYIVGLYQMGLEADAAAALTEAERRWPGFGDSLEMGNCIFERFTLHYFATGNLSAMGECLRQAQALSNNVAYYHSYKRMVLATEVLRTDAAWGRYQSALDPLWIYLPYDHVQDAVVWMKQAGVTPTPRMLAAADPGNAGQPADATALLHRAEYAYCTDANSDLAIQLTARVADETEKTDPSRWLQALAYQAQYLCGNGRLEEARATADRMEAALPQFHGAETFVYMVAAKVAEDFADYARAQEYMSKIAKVLEANGEEASLELRAQAARLFMRQGYYAETADILLDYAERCTENRNVAFMSQAWLDVGEGLLAQKKYEAAVEALDKSLSSVMRKAGVDYPIDVAIQVDSQVALGYAYLALNNLGQADEYFGRATTASQRGQTEDRWWTWQTARASLCLQTKNLAEAQKWIEAALASVEKQRASLRDFHNRGALFNNKAKTFGVAIQIALARNDLAGAFYYTELSRARGFLDELGQHASQVTVPKPIQLVDFQKDCGRSAAICYYQLDNELLAWVVHSNQVDLVRLPVTAAEAEMLVAQFNIAQRRDELAGRPLPRVVTEQLKKMPDGMTVAQNLYTRLWAPVEAKLKPDERVCILPHQRLHYLPFQSFFDGKKFLVEKHDLFYIPSATALGALSVRKVPANDAVLLVEAAQVNDPKSGFYVTETEALEKLYPKAVVQAHAGATVTAFLKQAPAAGIIHLSCHGYFDPEIPLNSGLALGDAKQDIASLLSARRIYSQRYERTQLVVMSACVSSVGGLAGGDDVTGITRAFQAAGVPNVVGSLWPVDNKATTELMTAFYTALQKTPDDPVKALCAAQREKIQARDTIAHWSGFELNGTGKIQR